MVKNRNFVNDGAYDVGHLSIDCHKANITSAGTGMRRRHLANIALAGTVMATVAMATTSRHTNFFRRLVVHFSKISLAV